MTVQELARWLNARNAAPGTDETAQVHCGYAGDLLSWVLGHGRAGMAWVTVLTHENVAAVAVLTKAACVILPDGLLPERELLERARQENLPILTAGQNAYQVCLRMGQAGIGFDVQKG